MRCVDYATVGQISHHKVLRSMALFATQVISIYSAVLLARVRAEAPQLDVGVISLLPLHHPVELAEQIATLDTICNGRLILAAAPFA